MGNNLPNGTIVAYLQRNWMCTTWQHARKLIIIGQIGKDSKIYRAQHWLPTSGAYDKEYEITSNGLYTESQYAIEYDNYQKELFLQQLTRQY